MKLFRVLIAEIFLYATMAASPAAAQWQTPIHSVPIGQGGGNIGFNSAAPASAGTVLMSNGVSSDPSFQSLPAAPAVAFPVDAFTTDVSSIMVNCGHVISMAGGFHTLTLPSASTAGAGCFVFIKNNEAYTGRNTGRGKKIVGASPSFAINNILYPKQSGALVSDGTVWHTVIAPGRWKIVEQAGLAEMCVRQDGDDTSDGLGDGTVAADCLAHVQKALVVIGEQWDGGGYGACNIGIFAGGTSIINESANQTGQSVGCYLTINFRGNVKWTATGSCFIGGDNSITIFDWSFGFVPTFACNSANTASTGQLKCHQYCVFDISLPGGTAIWLPGGSNDTFFDCDLQCSATYNAQVNVGDGTNTYTAATFMACEAHCSKITLSGTVAFSAHVTFNQAFQLKSGSVITTSLTWPGATITNPTVPSGNSVLITNGTTIPGGTTPTAPGSGCAQNSSFGLVCLTAL